MRPPSKISCGWHISHYHITTSVWNSEIFNKNGNEETAIYCFDESESHRIRPQIAVCRLPFAETRHSSL